MPDDSLRLPVRDVTAVLADLQIARAYVVGHDWGATVG
jgi:pimeloyl-ACP methyl ester carboxylesterase